MAYQTAQSRRILAVLRENKARHLTAEEVYLLLKEQGTPVGQTTVYRHLEKLCAEGTLRKFAGADGGGACFQFAENGAVCKEHYHLKCTSCGALLHAECDFLDELSAHILADHGFTIDGSRTVLYGLCAACAEKENRNGCRY